MSPPTTHLSSICLMLWRSWLLFVVTRTWCGRSILSVATPMAWAALYRFFLSDANALAVLCGPGGHFIVAAAIRVVSSLVLSTCPSEHLSLE